MVDLVTAESVKGRVFYVEGHLQVDQKEKATYVNVIVEKLVPLDQGVKRKDEIRELANVQAVTHEQPDDIGEPVGDEETPF